MNLPRRFVCVCSAITLLLVASTVQAGDLKIKENDRIVILGNTFAERMHLFGYFETFLHSRFPEHRLRIRYLAWPAEEVGRAADEMATQPRAWEKGYVPESKKVLQATRLLKPGESELLTFNVPGKPGKYEFVCTFPGHWRTMYGVFNVNPG